jgi:hypothetical protein
MIQGKHFAEVAWKDSVLGPISWVWFLVFLVLWCIDCGYFISNHWVFLYLSLLLVGFFGASIPGLPHAVSKIRLRAWFLLWNKA